MLKIKNDTRWEEEFCQSLGNLAHSPDILALIAYRCVAESKALEAYLSHLIAPNKNCIIRNYIKMFHYGIGTLH